MTSKEALNRLSEYIGELGGGETLEEEDVILTDLEVLQVLKDKLPHITTLRVMEYEGTYELYNSINCTSITKEEYELLKGWLNDK